MLVFAGDALAKEPPKPKPLPACRPEQVAKVTLFACPSDTTRMVGCPVLHAIDMAGASIDIYDAVIEWCAPPEPSRYDRVGVEPFEGGPARGPYAVWYGNGQKAHEGTFPMRGTTWTKWHRNGTRSSVKSFGPDGEQGPTTEWHTNGQKAFAGTYDRGMRVGNWTWWYPNGSLQETVSYVANHENGPWIRYYDNGKKKSLRDYRNGSRTGRWLEWYPDGSKAIEATCRDFELVGRYRSWAPDGTVLIDREQHGASC
jgi:antitoxin component YwqK of YwqJK toxin-antitoxin module